MEYQKLPFLKVRNAGIVDGTGKSVVLKGVNLGGWLMMEGYMLGGRNIAERDFKRSFENALGAQALEDFTRSFRDNFIREDDIRTIKGWGANCIRIPFNYRLIEFEERPFSLNEEGLVYLDRAVEWCENCGIYCILDLHAAPGAQNTDWHADCSATPEFFTNDFNKDRYFRLWRFLASRYNDSSAVAGYDVLNEPLVPFLQESALKDLYIRVTKEIRDEDKNHIIFLEGNFWGQRLKFLGKPADKNTAYSVHAYPLPEFAFNWEPGLVYPGKLYGIMWDKDKTEFFARQQNAFAKKAGAPLYVGEFGVNWRDGHYGELKWVKDLLDIFKKYDSHWTYWTYKTVANYIFPDGIYRYVKNRHWVNRKGPVSGLEILSHAWPRDRDRIVDSWRTENFELNTKLCSLLKKYFK